MIRCMCYANSTLIVDFTLKQYSTMESIGFAEIEFKLSGGILPVPISVTINSLALSAIGKYVMSVCMHLHTIIHA